MWFHLRTRDLIWILVRDAAFTVWSTRRLLVFVAVGIAIGFLVHR